MPPTRGLTDRIRHGVRAWLMSDAPPEQFLRGVTGVSAAAGSGVHVTDQAALGVATVLSCVKVLAESISTLPLQVFERLPNGDKRPAPQHPVNELLHTLANEETTAQSLRETSCAHVLLRGDSYVRVARDGAGVVRELWPMNSAAVRPYRGKDGRLRFEYSPNGDAPEHLLASQVWRVSGLSWNGVTGLSPIGFARESVGLAIALEQNTGSALRNGSRISGVVSYQETLDGDEYERREAAWRENLSGAQNAGKVFLADAGAKFEKVGMTLEDMEFLELKRFQVAEIARLFRVPLHMLYDQAAQPRANMEQASLEFVTYTLRPWLVRYEQTISRDLFSREDRSRYFAEHNVAGLLRGDFAARMAGYAQGRQWGWLSVNDVLRLENLNGIGPQGDVYLQPSNMAPAGSAGPTGA